MKTFKDFLNEANGGNSKKWMADFQKELLTFNKKYSGKIDWDTAKYLMDQGISPKDAAVTYHEKLSEAKKDGTEPDGTGPHGRGAGPGKGKSDGSGKKKKDDELEEEKKMDAKKVADKMRKDKTLKPFADKVAKMGQVSTSDLENILPDYISGKQIRDLCEAKMSDQEVLSAAQRLAKNAKDTKTKEFGQGLVDYYKKNKSFTPEQVGGLQNIMKNASFQLAKDDKE